MTRFARLSIKTVFIISLAVGIFSPTITFAQSGSGNFISDENVYLLSEQITLTAPALKDVFALGSDVVINAPVSGDLQVFARTVRVNAPVTGDIRIAAGEIYIENTRVEGDMLLTGGNITVNEKTSASGSTMIFGANTVFEGSTGKSLLINSSDTKLGGTHSGAVEVSSSILSLLDSFQVKGALVYSTNSEVDIKPGMIGGKVTKEEIQNEESTLWDRIYAALSTFLSLFIGLMILIWTYPEDLLKRISVMKTQPLSSFLKGFLGGLLLPFVLIILTMTLVGFPLGIALLFIYFAIVFLSPLFAVMYLGFLILPNAELNSRSLLKVAMVGSIIATLILQIPVLGIFIMILLSSLAFGTFLRKKETLA